MRGLIAGCACAGGAGLWALGGGAGADAEVTVHKPPQAVYAAVSDAFDQMEISEVIPADDGSTVAFQVTVEREPGESLSSAVLVDGEEAARVEFTVSAEDGGAATRLTGDLEVDQAVLQKHLADGPNQDVTKIPEFAFDMAMKAALKDMAEKIEAGMPLASPGQSLAALRMQHRQGTPSNVNEQMAQATRRYAEQEKMRQATQPALDPNAAAREYLKKP